MDWFEQHNPIWREWASMHANITRAVEQNRINGAQTG
jgi:hypothetical protein